MIFDYHKIKRLFLNSSSSFFNTLKSIELKYNVNETFQIFMLREQIQFTLFYISKFVEDLL